MTVRVTTRIAGSASNATTASGSLGACRTPLRAPTTRVALPAAERALTLNRLSCAASASTMAVLRGATADDAPVTAGRADRRLGEDGLVRPVERAQPQVHDAGRHGARPDQRSGLGGQSAQHTQAEPGGPDGHRHAGPSGKRNSAIDAGFMVAL